MIWIEFTGPSGIGKSFWYEKVIKLNNSFNSERIVVENYLKSSSNLTLKELCYKVLFLCNIKRSAITNLFFSKIKSQFKITHNKSDSSHIELFMKGLVNYDLNAINQLRLLNHYTEKFKEHKVHEYYLSKSELFLSEDGIVHTNFGNLSSCESDIVLPDLIINLKASDTYILKNRLNRINKGQANLIEQRIQRNDLKDYVKLYNANYYQKIEKLKQKNVPVADFDVENNTTAKDILQEITEFIKTK